MSEKLKKDFLDLLEKDKEFRYTVAGYLGLSELLKRLDRIEEGQNRLWEEVRGLREGQNKLWENQNKLWEELRSLKENQNKLWENQNKLWEEVRSLRENQNRLWEEVRSLRENQNKLWEEVKMLRINHNRMYKYMVSGFRELRRTLGVAFEDHIASFLEVMLEEKGYKEAKVEKKFLAYRGKVIDINLFCEKPLLVGEATVSIKSDEEAEREVGKLLRRVNLVERKYKRKPEMVILSVARVAKGVKESLKRLAGEKGIKLVVGKEVIDAI